MLTEIVITGDGTETLRNTSNGQLYHSRNGAVAETDHIYIAAGLSGTPDNEISVLEVGFGLGLNAWRTWLFARANGKKINYTSLELEPVAMETVLATSYADSPEFVRLHMAAWEEEIEIAHDFTITKIKADISQYNIEGIYDVVYFDLFSPDIEPYLWSVEIFTKLASRMKKGGVLVTYSSRGTVKEALRDAGLVVRRLPGPTGKRHILRAIKQV